MMPLPAPVFVLPNTMPMEASPKAHDSAGPSPGLIACAALFVAFVWPALRVLGSVYWNNADYSHGLLVPLIAAYFAYERWEGRGDREYRSSWLGVPLVVMGMGLMLLGYCELYICPGGLGEAFFCALGMLVCLAGLCVGFGGLALAWTLAFPLGYLIFAVPWPLSLSNRVTVPLRLAATAGAGEIIRVVGVPVRKEGNILHLPNGPLNVTDACSGIRSLGVMLAAGAGLGYWMRCGAVRAAALCVLAVPIATLVNFLRVALTGLLVAWVGPEWASGSRHEACGLVAFALGLAAMVGIVWLLAPSRAEEEAADDEEGAIEPSAGRLAPSRGVWICTACLLVCGTAARVAIGQRYRVRYLPTDVRKSFASFPNEVGGFRLTARREANAEILEKLRPSDVLECTYETASGEPAELSIMYWAPFKTRTPKYVIDMHPHRPDGCYPAMGWTRDGTFDVEAEIEGIPFGKVRIQLFRKAGRSLVVLYWVRKTGMTPDYWSPSPGLRGRLMDLARYWNDPLVLRGDQYYVKGAWKRQNRPNRPRRRWLGWPARSRRFCQNTGSGAGRACWVRPRELRGWTKQGRRERAATKGSTKLTIGALTVRSREEKQEVEDAPMRAALSLLVSLHPSSPPQKVRQEVRQEVRLGSMSADRRIAGEARVALTITTVAAQAEGKQVPSTQNAICFALAGVTA